MITEAIVTIGTICSAWIAVFSCLFLNKSKNTMDQKISKRVTVVPEPFLISLDVVKNSRYKIRLGITMWTYRKSFDIYLDTFI